jgi:hypothetical protein
MTTMQSTGSTVPADIDIFKHRHEMLTGIPGKKRRRRLTITLEDLQRRPASLSSHNLRVQIGFDATGNYHRTLAHHPYKSGVELKLVSSVGLALTRITSGTKLIQRTRKSSCGFWRSAWYSSSTVNWSQPIRRAVRNCERPTRSSRAQRPSCDIASLSLQHTNFAQPPLIRVRVFLNCLSHSWCNAARAKRRALWGTLDLPAGGTFYCHVFRPALHGVIRKAAGAPATCRIMPRTQWP